MGARARPGGAARTPLPLTGVRPHGNEEALPWTVSGEGVDLDFDVPHLPLAVIWFFQVRATR